MGSKTYPRPNRRTDSCVCRAQLRGHFAHVGPDVVVHYRWHPLHGRRVRSLYKERRANGDVVHIEAKPGVVTILAAWMLDPIACAGMEIGAPRTELPALVDLHHLLIALGFRRDSRDDSNVRPPVRLVGRVARPPALRIGPPLRATLAHPRSVGRATLPTIRACGLTASWRAKRSHLSQPTELCPADRGHRGDARVQPAGLPPQPA